MFAASLLRARKYKVKPTGPQIGLVPCAWGGSAIAEWERGEVLYDRMIERTKAAMQSGGALKAVLWYQGESDADRKSRAEHYEQKLITFFNNVRADLQSPDLPIFQVIHTYRAFSLLHNCLSLFSTISSNVVRVMVALSAVVGQSSVNFSEFFPLLICIEGGNILAQSCASRVS